jgi:hypothetical protein
MEYVVIEIPQNARSSPQSYEHYDHDETDHLIQNKDQNDEGTCNCPICDSIYNIGQTIVNYLRKQIRVTFKCA